jgi:hypothetical protein
MEDNRRTEANKKMEWIMEEDRGLEEDERERKRRRNVKEDLRELRMRTEADIMVLGRFKKNKKNGRV